MWEKRGWKRGVYGMQTGARQGGDIVSDRSRWRQVTSPRTDTTSLSSGAVATLTDHQTTVTSADSHTSN